MLSHARRNRRGQRALRMWTTRSAVSRLDSGRYARSTLDTVEKYALAIAARVEIRVRPGW